MSFLWELSLQSNNFPDNIECRIWEKKIKRKSGNLFLMNFGAIVRSLVSDACAFSNRLAFVDTG
jgi:hypothetical protein